MARRNGDEWFLGSMSDWSGRDLQVPLSFLGSGRCTAEIYSDSPDAGQYPKSVRIHTETVDSSKKLTIKTVPGGRYAVRFAPAK